MTVIPQAVSAWPGHLCGWITISRASKWSRETSRPIFKQAWRRLVRNVQSRRLGLTLEKAEAHHSKHRRRRHPPPTGSAEPPR